MKIKLNGKDVEIAVPIRIIDLLEKHGLLGKPMVVELNGEIVKGDRYASVQLADGDAVEVVGLVGGG
jgi:thiamine biosynthesis protein ThiS